MARKNNKNSEFGVRNSELGDDSPGKVELEESAGARNARPQTADNEKPMDEDANCGDSVESVGARNARQQKVDDGKPDDEGAAWSEAVDTTEPAVEIIDPMAALQNDFTAERDKYLRLAAEYDNFRKRSIKERESLYGNARADTITRLLPVYDNLERALKMECADVAFYKGVEMTMTQLTEIFEGMNVKQIPSVGEVFDPNRHDAVMSVEDPELGEKIVKEECKKGFMLGERIIRHSTVVVAN